MHHHRLEARRMLQPERREIAVMRRCRVCTQLASGLPVKCLLAAQQLIGRRQMQLAQGLHTGQHHARAFRWFNDPLRKPGDGSVEQVIQIAHRHLVRRMAIMKTVGRCARIHRGCLRRNPRRFLLGDGLDHAAQCSGGARAALCQKTNTHSPHDNERVLMPDIACAHCPLRPLPLFLAHNDEELALVQSLKQHERSLAADTALIHEGQTDAPLYTLLSGWAFRYKTLSDGRRQILSFLLAGDFIGVQQKMSEAAAHGVMTITAARLCVFKRDALWEMHRRSPVMGFNITWLTAHEESLVDDNLLSVGRRNAEERIATLLIQLFKRAAALQTGAAEQAGVPFPLTQQHIADSLGLSLVHTNKTLRKLELRGLHRIADGRLYLRDATALARLADLYGDGKPAQRPLV